MATKTALEGQERLGRHEKQQEVSGSSWEASYEKRGTAGGEGQNGGYCPTYLITVIFLEPSALPFTMI